MIDAEKLNRQEDRLQTIGLGVLIAVAAMAVVLVWLGYGPI